MKLKNYAILFCIFIALAAGSCFALALPDMTISNVLADPSSVCNGQYQVVLFNVTNLGNMNIVNGIAGLYINNNFYSSINQINLSPGTSVRKIMLLPVNGATAISIRADPYGSISEANENNNIYSYTLTGVSCSSAATASPLKRFYKSADLDHFYTVKDSEVSNAIAKGYTLEGTEGKILTNYVAGTNPLIRMYSSGKTSHFYGGKNDVGTMQYLIGLGYNYEGIEGYVYNYQASGTVPLYHSYKTADIDNFYTINYTEYQKSIASSGYQANGIEGYVYPNDIAPASLPDLTIVNVAANPATSCSGQTVNVNFDVRNIGNAAASNAQVNVYLGSTLATSYTLSLAAGASMTKTYSYTSDSSAKAIRISADVSNLVKESNENNNNYSITISSSSCSNLPLKGRKIVLDPGHRPGERTTGEFEATHNISRVLKPLLENLGAIVNETSSSYTLEQRTAFANTINPDIYVSIHFNGVDSTNAYGLEAFYGEQNPAGGTGTMENDIALCKKLVPEVQKLINSRLRDRDCVKDTQGILPDRVALNCTAPNYSLWVVRQTKMPACLVEMEFITAIPVGGSIPFNGKTYTTYKSLFLSADYTNAAANALKTGIVNYFNNTVTIAIVPNTTQPSNASTRVGWLSNGALYIPEGVLTGYCYPNGVRGPCSIAGKDVRVSGAFDWYKAQVKYLTRYQSGCGLTDTSMKSVFSAATLAYQNMGFSLFYNQSGTLYWLEVNASHPDILKDGTYQIMPTLNILDSQAGCNGAIPNPPVSNTTPTPVPNATANNRVGWLSTGQLYIPKGVLTGYCWVNGVRTSNCNALGKDVRISGSFDWYKEQVKYTPMTASLCGFSESAFRQKYLNASQEYQNKGFSLVYYVGTVPYWLEVNASHPDILTDGTYQIRPTLNINSSQAICS